MKAKVIICAWAISLFLMVLGADTSLWITIPSFVVFARLSVYINKHEDELLRHIKEDDDL